MKDMFRMYLLLCACCVIALRAYTIREPREPDDFDFEFEQLGEASEEEEEAATAEELAPEEASPATKQKDALRATPTGALEPEAEMLPADFEGIESPGVDHMEMNQQPDGKFLQASGKKVRREKKNAQDVSRS